MPMDSVKKTTIIHSTALLFGLLMVLFQPTVAEVGACYGMTANNLPSPSDVINLFQQNNIRRVRLYGPNEEALQALGETDIKVLLDVPNPDIEYVAANQANADQWVQDHVLRYNNVNFQYIAVGNEVNPSDSYAQFLFQAIQNVNNAIVGAGLGGNVKVSTATYFAAVKDTYPPSNGNFQSDYQQILGPVIPFLRDNQAPLLVNIYPYFTYAGNTAQISLDYALFNSDPATVMDGEFQYQILFDAMLDAFYAALEKVDGGSDLDIVVSESGWPTEGGEATNSDNAKSYNQNLIVHVNQGQGTPRKSGKAIEAYIFAMFDEN